MTDDLERRVAALEARVRRLEEGKTIPRVSTKGLEPDDDEPKRTPLKRVSTEGLEPDDWDDDRPKLKRVSTEGLDEDF